MDFIEITAKTVEEAITEAVVKLGTTSDNIEYEVIEAGSNGILGIGKKPAKIKARKKQQSEDLKATVQDNFFVKEDNEKKDVQNNKISGDKNIEEVAREFLEKVFKAMNLTVTMDIKVIEEEKTMEINLSGDEMGLLIGKRGQTIDSLQYLVSLVVNKESEDYLRVKVDTENYRERRKATLEELAKNIAYKVKRTKRSVSLEPMNPYERRIIHSALQNDKYVTTKSEGEEPYRHIIVMLKK